MSYMQYMYFPKYSIISPKPFIELYFLFCCLWWHFSAGFYFIIAYFFKWTLYVQSSLRILSLLLVVLFFSLHLTRFSRMLMLLAAFFNVNFCVFWHFGLQVHFQVFSLSPFSGFSLLPAQWLSRWAVVLPRALSRVRSCMAGRSPSWPGPGMAQRQPHGRKLG